MLCHITSSLPHGTSRRIMSMHVCRMGRHVMERHVVLILSRLVTSRRVMVCVAAWHVTQRHVLSCLCRITSLRDTSCRVTSCHVASRLVTSGPVMSRRVASCCVLSRHVVSCLSNGTSRHVRSRRVRSRLVRSHHVALRRVLSCNVASRHVTSWRVAPCETRPGASRAAVSGVSHAAQARKRRAQNAAVGVLVSRNFCHRLGRVLLV